ncbi:hypothetical protein COCNU_05G004610 [Cocos nucifera]|uniref:Uncharacterized protein n=1 Tax=Cocos nucifera TaxID=13894 RepID=A0A8K0I8A0_COCNU|nr:hypothetical protein COCNU_05G004610 [Cocos nucifera]
MLHHEVLDAFLCSRAESHGTHLLPGLFTSLEPPSSFFSGVPSLIHYTSFPTLVIGTLAGTPSTLAVNVLVGTDRTNSHIARSITVGTYSSAIAFQEEIRLPPEKMTHYEDLAKMYVGNDISPDFYEWAFLGKFLTLVTHQESLEAKVNETKAMVKFQLKKVLCMGVAEGNRSMEEKQIFQNVQLGVNFLVSLLKKNW